MFEGNEASQYVQELYFINGDFERICTSQSIKISYK